MEVFQLKSSIFLLTFCLYYHLAISNEISILKNLPIGRTEMIRLLTSLVLEKMDHCTLVFIFNAEDQAFEEESYSVLESMAQISSNGIFIRKLYPPTEKISIKFPPEYYDLHKIRDKCVTTILSVHQLLDTYVRLTFNLLRNYLGIMTKDTAYFILLTHKEIIDQLLVTPKLAMKIKYKIAVSHSGSDVLVKTTCFYCNSGEPLLLNVDLKTPHIDGRNQQFKSLDEIFPDMIQNFYGKSLSVCQAKGVIWLGEIRQKDGVWRVARGCHYQPLFAAMAKYNFTATYFPSSGGGTGNPFPNGTWSGTIGHVAAEECDIGKTTARNRERSQQVGFSFPVTYERLTYTFKKPAPYLSWKAIIWPLDSYVWASTLAAFSLVMFTFILMARFTRPETYKSDGKKIYKRYKNEKYKKLWKIFEYVFGSIVEQGPIGPTIFPSHSLRLMSAIWLVFVMVLGTAYRSKLINFMAFPIMEVPPLDFDELAQSDYRVILQTVGGAALQLFSTSKNPSYQKLYQRMELEWDAAKCFGYEAMKPKTSCIGYVACADYAINRNLTDSRGQLTITRPQKDIIGITTVQMVFEYYAIFRAFIDHVLITSHDSGLVLKWLDMDENFVKTERREWEKATNQTRFTYAELEEGSGALKIGHVLCSFYLLFIGIIASAAIFIAEYGCNWRNQRKSMMVDFDNN